MKIKGSDLQKSDAAESDADNASEMLSVESEVEAEPSDKKSAPLVQLSISLRSLVIATVIVALVGAVGVLAWFYMEAQRKLDAEARRSNNNAHAEKMALDYAVSAAEINSSDLNAWKVKLVAGTSPELNKKLTKAADEIDQVLVPLQWNSTARPLAAKTRADTGGVYNVDCFVSVLTKTIQAPDPLQSTATYSVTIDSNKNWQITDVGGIGAIVGAK